MTFAVLSILSRELRAGDPGRDPLAGHVGNRLVRQVRDVGSSLADQMVTNPLADDALQLPEKVQPRVSCPSPETWLK